MATSEEVYRAQDGYLYSIRNGSALSGGVTPTAKGMLGMRRDAPNTEAGFEELEGIADTTFAARRSYTVGSFISDFSTGDGGMDIGKRVSVTSLVPNMASMASGALDAACATYLDSIPDTHTTYLTIYHEFDWKIGGLSSYTVAQWAPAFKRFCDRVHAEGRPKLKTYICPTDAWWSYHGVLDPNTYWATDELNGYVDVFAPDSYNNYVRDGHWDTPSKMLDPLIAFAASKGVPWGICEIGCDEDSADATRKATWLGQLGAKLDDPNCAFVCYYSSTGSTGSPIRWVESSTNSINAFKTLSDNHPIPSGVTV